MKRSIFIMQSDHIVSVSQDGFAKSRKRKIYRAVGLEKLRIDFWGRKLSAGLLLIVGLFSLLVSSGCMTRIMTSSYDIRSKSKKETRQTNFRVESVSADFAHEQTLIKVLRQRERDQNEFLVPVPYRVKVDERIKSFRDDNPVSQFLFLCTLSVWPSYEGWRRSYNIQTDIPGSLVSIKGTESETDIYGWVALPFSVPLILFLQDGIDFRPGSLEERLGNAAFDSLTKARYDLAIAEMTKQAIGRLKAGDPLSIVDERLIATIPKQELLVHWAKRPNDVNRSKEALQEIDNVEDLLDVALHAAQLQIREEAAKRVSGLSGSRFADLVRETKDESVGGGIYESCFRRCLATRNCGRLHCVNKH